MPTGRRPPEPSERPRPRVAVALDLDSGPRAPGSPPPPGNELGGAAPLPPALRLARQLATRLNAPLLGLPARLSAVDAAASPHMPVPAGPSRLASTGLGSGAPSAVPGSPRFASAAALTSALLAAATNPATLLLVVPLPAAPTAAPSAAPSATAVPSAASPLPTAEPPSPAIPLPIAEPPAPATPPGLAALLAVATRPLLLVPPAAPLAADWPGFHRLLVPLDGAPSTFRALAPVVALAGRLGTALDLLCVADPAAPPPAEPGVLSLPAYPDQPQHEWPEWEREVLATLTAFAGRFNLAIPARVSVAPGPAADAILAHAAETAADALALVRRSYPMSGRAPILRALLARAARPIFLAPAQPPLAPPTGVAPGRPPR